MEEKWIVVTGGTKGIGRGIMEAFMEDGFNALTCARNTSDLSRLNSELAEKYPAVRFYSFPADLSDKQSCFAFADFIRSKTSQVDVLVNNTGHFIPGQIQNEEDGVFESMMQTNLNSAYYLTKSLLSDMIRRREGYIFNICSTASIIPYVNGGSYCISKHALYGLSKVLREELKEHRIKVTSVLPGATYTSSWEGAGLPESRFMKVSDVAQAVLNCWKLSPQAVVEELTLRPLQGDI